MNAKGHVLIISHFKILGLRVNNNSHFSRRNALAFQIVQLIRLTNEMLRVGVGGLASSRPELGQWETRNGFRVSGLQ